MRIGCDHSRAAVAEVPMLMLPIHIPETTDLAETALRTMNKWIYWNTDKKKQWIGQENIKIYGIFNVNIDVVRLATA